MCQVSSILKVVELKADAVLVSRVVTQRDEHITELKNFLACLSAEPGVQPHLLKICGGPRITHQDALEWGYDDGFGPGTKPSGGHRCVQRVSFREVDELPGPRIASTYNSRKSVPSVGP